MVDIKPDSLKKNAKAFGFKVSRAGIPLTLKPLIILQIK